MSRKKHFKHCKQEHRAKRLQREQEKYKKCKVRTKINCPFCPNVIELTITLQVEVSPSSSKNETVPELPSKCDILVPSGRCTHLIVILHPFVFNGQQHLLQQAMLGKVNIKMQMKWTIHPYQRGNVHLTSEYYNEHLLKSHNSL